MWTFETAPSTTYNAPIEELHKFNVGELIADIFGYMKAKSSPEAYQKTFAAMDEAGNQLVDAEDFRWGMIDLGYSLSKFEADQLVAHFDANGSGLINYAQFLAKAQEVSLC